MSAPSMAARSAQAAPPAGRLGRLVRLAVRRRVAISVVLFTALALLDIFVIDNQPRNVTNWRNPWVAVGEAMILAGLLLRTWAAGTLFKKRQLATTGPYAWVRNPLYLGSFLMMAGFSALVHDPVSLWLLIGPVAWLYWQAVRFEERTMERLFPDEWPLYRQQVGAFVPRRIVLPRFRHWSWAQWLYNREYEAWLGTAAGLAGIYAWRLWL